MSNETIPPNLFKATLELQLRLCIDHRRAQRRHRERAWPRQAPVSNPYARRE